MAQVTTLSSLGVSAPIILNPVSKSTSIQVTVASGSSGFNINAQVTLDDPTTTPPPTITWSNISSAALTSSGIDGIGQIYSILTPIGGLRLSSTSTVTGAITLKALQNIMS